jgi:SWI/SNF-related matrix-associated actin-dependent regulator of chromatin subfamily A member 5
MRTYQLEALNWLIRLHDSNLNGILADEMGYGKRQASACSMAGCGSSLAHPCHSICFLVCSLGKTLESLSFLAYLKQFRNDQGPHLIIVPKSTSSNWLREVNRWTDLTVHRFHGNQEERDAQKPLVDTHNITVTTYEMVIREKGFFAKKNWHYM